MYCPRCGAENAEGVQVCYSCSAFLDGNETPAVVEAVKTSGLAITSMVLGILCIFTCCITALPAIITGIIALINISKSNGMLKGRGMAITGIAITVPMILIYMVAMLVAIMVPAFSQARGTARRVACSTNMRTLAQAMEIYAVEYDGKYPTGPQWCDLLIEETGIAPQSLVCPVRDQSQSNYALNANAVKLGKDAPSDMVLMFECEPGWNLVGGPELITTENHMGQGCNILHVDGHVEFVRTQDFNRLRWTVDEFEEVKYETNE